MKKYISEFLGSAFLFCAVVGSGIMAQNLTNDESIILFINSIINCIKPDQNTEFKAGFFWIET